MSTPYELSAQEYANSGWSPIALAGKFPPPTGYTGYAGEWVTGETVGRLIREWVPRGKTNVAIRLPDGVVGIDVDEYDKKTGEKSLAEMESRLGPLPDTWSSTSREGKSGIYLFRTPPGIWWRDAKDDSIDLIHMGHRYVMAAPSVHPKTGNRYRWYSPDGVVSVGTWGPHVEELAELPAAWIAELQKGWLVDRTEKVGHSDAVVAEWLAQWEEGEKPCFEMSVAANQAVKKLRSPGVSHHDEARNRVLQILWLASEGHRGIHEALEAVVETLREEVDRDVSSEWDRILRGGVDILLSESGGEIGAEREPDACDPAGDFGDPVITPTPIPNARDTPSGSAGSGSGSASSGKAATTSSALTTRGRDIRDIFTHNPARFMRQGGGMEVEVLARHISNEIPVGKDELDGRLMVYRDGVWRDGEADIAAAVTVIFGDMWSAQKRNTVMDFMRDSPDTPRMTRDAVATAYVNCRNGMIDWASGFLENHDERHRSTVQIPWDYVPGADCPEFKKYLTEVLPPDCLDFIWEVLGYMLYSGNPLHRIFLLWGKKGRNGKSTYLHVLENLLGKNNVSNIKLHAMAGDDKFASADLYGRLANVAGEVSARWLESTSEIKELSGGERISAQRKFGQPFFFEPWATHIFSANEMFGAADSSEAWFARWIPIVFPNSFYGREDPGMLVRVTTRVEMEGILAGAIEGLARLMKRGRFAEPASVVAARGEMANKGDAVRRWATERCVLDTGCWTPQTELLFDYQESWEDDSKKVGRNTFYERLDQIEGLKSGKRNGIKGYHGVRLKLELEM